jgi:hypothetical protein
MTDDEGVSAAPRATVELPPRPHCLSFRVAKTSKPIDPVIRHPSFRPFLSQLNANLKH